MFAFNELQSPDEKKTNSEELAQNSFGFQAGTEFSFPLSKAAVLSFGIEGVYTYPFFYISSDKRWSFYKRPGGNSGSFAYWTGTPFGPDSIAVSFWTEYATKSWSIGGSFLFLVQGERSKFSIFDTRDYHPVLIGDYEKTNLKTPTGIPSYTYEIQLKGTWTPKEWLSLSLSPGYRIVSNYDNIKSSELEHGFEITLAAQYRPGGSRNIRKAWN
jgi:hypothetical protein